MQNLQEKVSADTPKNKRWSRKISDKEIVYSTMGVWVCVFGINIISHNIPSYIILHQWHKKGIQCWPSENASKKWNCAKAQNKFWRNTASSALMWRKKSIADEALMFLWRLEYFLRSIKALLYEAWKEGKVFFRRRLKNSMYIKVSCIAKKWITKPFIYYIQNPWAPNITSIVQQMLH